MERKPLVPARRPGIHAGVPMDEYLRWDAAGNSDLMNMKRSPAYANDQRTVVSEPSASTTFGIAVHARILQPEDYDRIVGVLPADLNLRTKDGRAHRDALYESHEVVISADVAKEVEACARSVFNHKAASVLVGANGPVEQSVIAEDPETGCPVKIRPDKLIPQKGVVLDVKTTRMPSEFAFTRQSFQLGYDRKLSFYLWVMNLLPALGPSPEYHTGAVLLIQNTPPYEPLVVAYKTRVLEAARVSWRRDLTRFAECRDTNVWPGFTETVKVLDYEDWMIASREGDEEGGSWESE